MKLRTLFGAANRARLATYLLALWKLMKHRDTPRGPKLVALVVLLYALSPIDLIPDFIPVLGQLDDLILLPLGIALAVKLTPKPLWEARLREAEASREKAPKLVWGAVFIVVLWVAMGAGLLWFVVQGSGAAQAAERSAASEGRPGVHQGAEPIDQRSEERSAARAPEVWRGVVTKVSDGDTVWVQRQAPRQRVKVRLVGLDAPERCQPWGEEASAALRERVLGREVEVRRRATDAHGRALGTLWLDGRDVGERLVREGHAWSSGWGGRGGPYAAEEQAARVAKRGLFADARAIKPRAFRKAHGACER